MERSANRGIVLKIGIIWLAILLVGSFWLAGRSDALEMTVVPQVPREGEPIIVAFHLNNPSSEATLTEYQFWSDGKMLQEGNAALPPGFSATYKYVYANTLHIGEQVNLVVKTRSGSEDNQKIVSSPSYPPQVWSSFVSFASFSTSVMSSMASMTYYGSSFGNDHEPKVGLIISLTLVALLFFAEIVGPLPMSGTVSVLKRLRISLSTLLWVLLILFGGLIYTSVVIVLQR